MAGASIKKIKALITYYKRILVASLVIAYLFQIYSFAKKKKKISVLIIAENLVIGTIYYLCMRGIINSLLMTGKVSSIHLDIWALNFVIHITTQYSKKFFMFLAVIPILIIIHIKESIGAFYKIWSTAKQHSLNRQK